ncbi:UNVERIFIED_ORG: hypothetical protein JN05_04680 [Zoogloea ramigera]|jgi:hypothetical protein|uniref:Uncharacterized protein n=1 Tax=Duganella zoogloeoides TaxID=75659 RepID=A0ABZ0XX58_9BURK|nr:hypothetical protein [Duganella zoogloeoides]WQH04335.1 hypothetical protein SR858_25410 [Duganella zoogloeoides]
MNIAKNMEAIFIATAIIAGATSLATASTPAPRIFIAADAVTTPAAKAAPMQVVTITAKRLTAAEKAAL